MKRTASKRVADHRQSKPKDTDDALYHTSAEDKIANKPASPDKLALVQEKRQKAAETAKMNKLSADMVGYIQALASGIEAATDSAQKTGDALENWEKVFTTMAEMNRGDAKSNETWVRLKTAPNQQ